MVAFAFSSGSDSGLVALQLVPSAILPVEMKSLLTMRLWSYRLHIHVYLHPLCMLCCVNGVFCVLTIT